MRTGMPSRQSGPSPRRQLSIYLRHHAAAARGGVDLFRRSARSQLDGATRAELAALAREVQDDRVALLDVPTALEIPRPRMAEMVVAWVQPLGQLRRRAVADALGGARSSGATV